MCNSWSPNVHHRVLSGSKHVSALTIGHFRLCWLCTCLMPCLASLSSIITFTAPHQSSFFRYFGALWVLLPWMLVCFSESLWSKSSKDFPTIKVERFEVQMEKFESDVYERFNQPEIDEICIFLLVRKNSRAITEQFYWISIIFPQRNWRKPICMRRKLNGFDKFHVREARWCRTSFSSVRISSWSELLTLIARYWLSIAESRNYDD